MNMKKIALLGSTGSIGTQTLDVVRQLNDRFQVVAVTANTNVELLNRQIAEFKPLHVGITHQTLKHTVKAGRGLKIYSGEEEILGMIEVLECDLVVVALAGAAGLRPAVTALTSGKSVALATKEVMVLAGELVNTLICQKNKQLRLQHKPEIDLYPIDSEHSAIWQSLRSGKQEEVEKIILTCSGGPFLGKTKEELKHVSVAHALNHPNWKMGKRITIDSATLMNKGLEVIEATRLFSVSPQLIEVVIHPQSILHSAVQFQDGSIIGQFGFPDMRLPIQYVLTYPERSKNTFSRLSLADVGSLTFAKPDRETFPCLSLAYTALEAGGTMPTVLNAADEVAVSLFLQEKISFLEIPELIATVMSDHSVVQEPTLEAILAADSWAREKSFTYNSSRRTHFMFRT